MPFTPIKPIPSTGSGFTPLARQGEQPVDPPQVPTPTRSKFSGIKGQLQKPGYELGQTFMNAADTLVTPFTSVGKAVFDVTSGKKFQSAIDSIIEDNNKILDNLKAKGHVKGTPEYEKGLDMVKQNMQLISSLQGDSAETRKDVGIAGLGNEDVSDLLSKGDYGRAFLTAATAGPAAFTGAVFSPLAVPAKTLIPGDGIASRVAQGVTTGAGLGGPAGAVAGGLFALIPDIENQVKKIPGVSEHLAENPGDEKIFNDVLSLTMSVLGQKLSKKVAPEGKPDILNTPISQVPGRVATNLVTTAAVPAKAVAPFVKKFADELEKENLRLTPQQKSNAKLKVNEVVDYNEKNNITGNPVKRFEKISNDVAGKEKTYQDFLTKGDGKNVTVSKQSVLSDLQKLRKQYEDGDTLDLNSSINKIDKAITKVEKYPDQIPASNLNNLKRDAFDSAYSNSGNNKLLDPVHNEIGGVLKGNLETATNGLKINGLSMADFNRNYGIALSSKTLLRLAQGRNQLGFLGRMTAKTVGGTLGGASAGPIGLAMGALFGDKVAQALMGTNMRSHVASLLSKLSSDEKSSLSNSVSSIATSKIDKNVISTNNTPNSKPAVVSSTQTPKAPPVGSFEQIQESGSGWKPGMREVFDTALLGGNKAEVLRLLPQVPAAYKATFAQKIIDILSK